MIFNEKKAGKLAERYGFECRCFNDTIFISTNLDDWYLEKENVYDKKKGKYVDKVSIYHKDKIGLNSKDKMRFHHQRYVSNLNQAFDLINNHEYYKITRNRTFHQIERMDALLGA